MGKPIEQLEVEIYDWPHTFFVEAEGPDREYYQFYPGDAEREVYPHFVDMEVYDTGWCSCRDFRFNVEPYIFFQAPHRRECIHIAAAGRYQRLLMKKPRRMPDNLF